MKPAYPGTLNVARATEIGLVGAWLFNDGAGLVAKDTSGNGNDGELVGVPDWVVGNFNGALDFEGMVDRVRVAGFNWNTVLGAGPGTVIVWAALDSITEGFNGLVCGFAQTGLFINPTTIYWQVGTGSMSVPQVVPQDGSYHQFVATKTGIIGEIFYDSVSLGTGACALDFSNTTVGIGAVRETKYCWDGIIDHVFICNKVLSQLQIDTLFADAFWPYGAPAPARAPHGVCRRPFQPEW